MSKQLKIIFYLSLLIFFSNCLRLFPYENQIPEPNQIKSAKDSLTDENIEIRIEQKDNKDRIIIGRNGTIYFKTNYNDSEKNIFDIHDIEERTSFNTEFQTQDSLYNVTCRLWKPFDGQIRTFCKFKTEEAFKAELGYLKEASFTFNNYSIQITSDILGISIIKYEDPIPFLYSDKQIINIDNDGFELIYYLKFKLDSYNNEILFLAGNCVNMKMLNECEIKENELFCKITKADIGGILSVNNGNLVLKSYNELMPLFQFPNVLEIIINIINYKKENIYVGITKLLENAYDEGNYVAYETNVTEISNLISEEFRNIKDFNCFFKKYSEKPLLILCEVPNSGTYSLGEIKNQIILNDINVKYNFIIVPVINQEQFEVSELGSHILNAIPSVLNFTIKEEITIELLISYSSRTNYIRIVPDSNDLNCKNVNDFVKRCIVTKSHFENFISGNYDIYHSNHLNKYSKFYEVPSFQVILPKDNKITMRINQRNNNNSIKFGKQGTLYFVTSYKDNQRHIFDNIFIEDISFKSKIQDLNNNEYDVFCKLWSPNEDYVRIFCDLNKKLKYSKQNITLSEVSFNFGQYEIAIIQEEPIEVEQIDYDISFLYSNKQNININDKTQVYFLSFEIKSYNNDLLYLYGQQNNYAVLDNCNISGKEIDCEISKNTLEEILVYNNTKFKIGAINDNIGIIPLDCILDININYQYIRKNNIYIEILKPINNISEKYNPVGYNTNVTSIPDFISDSFFGNFYFKKTKGNPLILYLSFDNEYDDYILDYFHEMTILDNIHYKYNFIILPYKGNDIISIRGTGTDIKLAYPKELNFTKKDFFTFRFIMTNPSYSENIKLNLNSNELICKNLKELKICNISLNHFVGEQNENYSIYHYNNKDTYLIYQDSPLINVILPKKIIDIYISEIDNKEGIYLGKMDFYIL